jgi:hypothetical protein
MALGYEAEVVHHFALETNSRLDARRRSTGTMARAGLTGAETDKNVSSPGSDQT